MSLTLSEIKELITDLENGSLRELSIHDGDFQLHLSKNDTPAMTTTTVAAEPSVAAIPQTPASNDVHPLAQPETPGVEIVAPMVGTVYLQPKPEAPAFKQVGDHVSVGETVAVVEAMKLMTEIHSEVAGTISEILVENEDVVDYNKPIYRVIPD
ncbi:acetyl-CoA carboxylase biotin carboxyl carrier protein [Leuconostoc fallax]|uniref:Biotin carboxyl carrier protein of acetyl-CoA carboxylase n=1 Tax=Leuconostoc fallax TaxID=1251 RepID=A0A4R5NBL2_9LACO|nr:acetyl-CoA carboxylase biotin carboxyl carrier protein [Leuconostoc fallax]MBU7454926.1 acetyl-CoA carboxylase biotin carboxyl carrier protein [Leuconostoc fallax]MCO6183198.1 acetyl-CoA carboxylase biotin carboxyl carrier protein [Leuconostoc fallax]TDG69491.1 hypothetical protein C5L23_000953 [Leuconostoc fallax]